MKKKISASVMAIIGTVLASSAKGDIPKATVSSVERQSVEAAQVLKELQAAGLIQIDPETGVIQLKGSVLEVMQSTGWAKDSEMAFGDTKRSDRSF